MLHIFERSELFIQTGLLKYNAKLFPVLRLKSDCFPIHAHRPLLHCELAGKKLEGCTLPTAVWADEGRQFARFGMEAHAIQCGNAFPFLCGINVCHLLE